MITINKVNEREGLELARRHLMRRGWLFARNYKNRFPDKEILTTQEQGVEVNLYPDSEYDNIKKFLTSPKRKRKRIKYAKV